MTHSKKMGLAAAGLAMTIMLITLLFIWPNYRQASSIRRQIEELQGKVEGFSDQTQKVQLLEKQLQASQDRVLNELKLIPDVPDLAGLIRKLSQDVDRVRVLDQTFTAGSPSEAIIGGKASAQAMPLTVDMEATFDSVFALVKNAESIDRLVRIATVRVLCKRDEKQSLTRPIVKASVGLEAIFDSPGSQEMH
jgi:hypothetical protein